MTAFNPFIPHDAKNSSIPSAFFELEVENTTGRNMKYQIALSVTNPYAKSINKPENKNGYHTVTLYNNGADKCDVEYGDLTIATDSEITYTKTYWSRGGWREDIIDFWNEFSNKLDFKERIKCHRLKSTNERRILSLKMVIYFLKKSILKIVLRLLQKVYSVNKFRCIFYYQDLS